MSSNDLVRLLDGRGRGEEGDHHHQEHDREIRDVLEWNSENQPFDSKDNYSFSFYGIAFKFTQDISCSQVKQLYFFNFRASVTF